MGSSRLGSTRGSAHHLFLFLLYQLARCISYRQEPCRPARVSFEQASNLADKTISLWNRVQILVRDGVTKMILINFLMEIKVQKWIIKKNNCRYTNQLILRNVYITGRNDLVRYSPVTRDWPWGITVYKYHRRPRLTGKHQGSFAWHRLRVCEDDISLTIVWPALFCSSVFSSFSAVLSILPSVPGTIIRTK